MLITIYNYYDFTDIDDEEKEKSALSSSVSEKSYTEKVMFYEISATVIITDTIRENQWCLVRFISKRNFLECSI
jgi:hypothetical protein